MPIQRAMPIGAEVQAGGGVHFRVWAPACGRVRVLLEGGRSEDGVPLAPETDGYFSGLVPAARAGTLYRFALDEAGAFPDPASRFQPEGPHGPSQVVDPGAFAWSDAGWAGVPRAGQVLYELHVGTFTRAGSWEAAARELPALAELGVTVLEVMPIADFPGEFGWGYDGVNHFAPSRLYGPPDALRAFVDRAHAVGLGVILDVVYNHFGPDGNYLTRFAPEYFTAEHVTDWGEAINFHGPGSAAVREYVLANAAYWIREFHLDGLRLDATQNIYDVATGGAHILAEVARAARTAAGARPILVVAENEPQDPMLLREEGGMGLDALWNDDFHHTTMVALTGRREAYYTDYRGTPQELISAARWGFLYQGQRYGWQAGPRGDSALDLPGEALVAYLQNHDQVANSARGERIHQLAAPAALRAMTAYFLLIPATPLLFQGQEFAASAPFLYFADHVGAVGTQVRSGRRRFLAQFPGLATPAVQARLADPADRATFERSRLDLGERALHHESYDLHRDLLRLRREDAVFRAQRADRLHGAVLGDGALVLRFLGVEGDDRLLCLNLGTELRLDPAPEPLLAPPAGRRWALRWSSEDPRYGGSGATAPESETGWTLPGHTAVVLAATPREERRDG